MTERFFLSPNPIDVDDSTPLVFLEGPVQGALDWQAPLAERLLAARDDIAVASPRPTLEHEVSFSAESETERERASDRQVAYEFIARGYAMDLGVIAMWWAPQDPLVPYPEGRVYGKTSNYEMGELAGWARAIPDYPLIVGYDPTFTASKANSMNYQLRNLHLMGRPIHKSLDELERAILAHLPTKGSIRTTHPSNARSMRLAWDLLRSKRLDTRSQSHTKSFPTEAEPELSLPSAQS